MPESEHTFGDVTILRVMVINWPHSLLDLTLLHQATAPQKLTIANKKSRNIDAREDEQHTGGEALQPGDLLR